MFSQGAFSQYAEQESYKKSKPMDETFAGQKSIVKKFRICTFGYPCKLGIESTS